MTDDILGRILYNRYYVEGIIHEGGMSAGYRAVDIINNIYVMIKVCRNSDIIGIAALKNEYRILKGLNHKGLNHNGIPGVYGYMSEESGDSLIMEYIDGLTLEYLMSNGMLSLWEALTIIKSLCRILIYLHDHSPAVYHCDIKPSNIIVAGDGCVTLIDFGVSLYGGEKNSACFGTEGYAAPEQFDASGNIDARTDIYSMGILLKNMLRASADYDKDTQKLGNIIKRCTSRDMCYRYSDVSEILTEMMYNTREDGTARLIYIS